jgi:hypothetical protein
MIDQLHEQAWDAFAWCTQDELTRAMKPVEGGTQ